MLPTKSPFLWSFYCFVSCRVVLCINILGSYEESMTVISIQFIFHSFSLAWWQINHKWFVFLAFCVVKLPGRQLHHTECQECRKGCQECFSWCDIGCVVSGASLCCLPPFHQWTVPCQSTAGLHAGIPLMHRCGHSMDPCDTPHPGTISTQPQ